MHTLEPIAETEIREHGSLLTRPQLAVLIALGVFELASALYIAHLNPVWGYDENRYLINAWRFQGHDNLPYADNRPPLLPMVLAIAGRHHFLVPALSHVGGWLLTFLILRRLSSVWPAIAGSALFALMPELRTYNLELLTESLSILLLLLTVWLYLEKRPALCGALVTCLAMSHWSMLIVPPVFFAAFALRDGWRAGVRCAGWSAAAVMPFVVLSAIAYGNPLHPILVHLRLAQIGSNDWGYYLHHIDPTWIPWLCGTGLAAWWVIRSHRSDAASSSSAPLFLLLALVLSRLALLHLIVAKYPRYLAPIIPLMLILTVCAIGMHHRTGRVTRSLAWCVLVWAVLPSKVFFWGLHDGRSNPTHQIVAFEAVATEIGLREPIYTDINDMAVMGLLHRRAVAVLGEGSWHHSLIARPTCLRGEIPPGAWYLTWDPGASEIVASREGVSGRALHLVRWCGQGRPPHSTSARPTQLQNESARTDDPAGSAPARLPVAKSLPSQRG